MRLHTLVTAGLAWHACVACSQPLGGGLDRSGFDASVRPQDDLFRAVNGQWLKDTPIPADKANYGSFIELRDRSDERVRKIVEDLALTQAAPGSNEQKVGSYFRSFTDLAAIDRAGLAPVAPWPCMPMGCEYMVPSRRSAFIFARTAARISFPVRPTRVSSSRIS